MLTAQKNLFRLFAVAVLLAGLLPAAQADDDDDDEHMPAIKNVLYQKECGSCHIAFPPRLLPAASWRAVMSGLDKHFGTDASVDAKSTQEIGAFLEQNAGHTRRATAGAPLLRITETRWFVHEHDEVSDRVWKNPKVKSPANCSACHPKAEQGNFDEHGIRIPR